MRQLIQNLKDGSTTLVEAPTPGTVDGHILIDTSISLISTGTERMLVNFGKSSLIAKARSQPEKVMQVIEKVKTEGVFTTFDAVRSKLELPIPLGYCNVGRVRVSKAKGFSSEDRVVSNGPHADVVSVPKHLAARIPLNVSDEEASFTVVASIGLQGLRLAKPTLGEMFVVTGVGLIGLLTVQLLRAHGCSVLAIDFDSKKLELARSFGAEICNPKDGQDPIAASLKFSRGRGVDGVIVTAATKSDEPITHAAKMCRTRGRIILVGVAGLNLKRSDFYEKELSFQVSCSYGPGRYDPVYESGGVDYPIGYVRWTEQRNFEAVLDMMASKTIDVSPLISHRVPFFESPKAYDILSTDNNALGILLEYPHKAEKRHQDHIALKTTAISQCREVTVGIIGAGNYASRFLIPAFKNSGAKLHTIASTGGLSAALHGRKQGFSFATSNIEQIISNKEINAVGIATRHDSHAQLTIDALNGGKHVFVEKPLALNLGELERIQKAFAKSDRCLMVGFNRRFSPHIKIMKKLLESNLAPKSFIMLMNSGYIPSEHWTHDPKIGGGRIIGEACHHIDLMRFLAGHPICSLQARRMGHSDGESLVDDKASITLGFEDGSFGTIHYFSNGGPSFPKERIEVFAGGGNLILNNFLKLEGYNWPGFRKKNLWRQDKGQSNCVKAFLHAIEKGDETPIPPAELFEVAKTAIDVAAILQNQK